MLCREEKIKQIKPLLTHKESVELGEFEYLLQHMGRHLGKGFAPKKHEFENMLIAKYYKEKIVT